MGFLSVQTLVMEQTSESRMTITQRTEKSLEGDGVSISLELQLLMTDPSAAAGRRHSQKFW